MNQAVTDLLRCPVCGAPGKPSENQKSFFCAGERRHCFDFSKSGYLNLAGPQGGAGDLKSAIRARSLFLNAGYYEPLSDALQALLQSRKTVCTVLDAGCGEGYYTNRFAQTGYTVLGIDLSVAGVDHAAKVARQAEHNAGFAVASLFHMPVADSSFDAVVSLFAPCAEDEFLRVLKPGGYLLLAGAGEEHLIGLKRVLYDDPYTNGERSDLPRSMLLLEQKKLTYEITVSGREMIDALFSMTPYYWRTSEHDRAKLDQADELTTTVDFDIYLYQKE